MNSTAETHVVLTLVVPPEAEEALLETLLDHPHLVPGFTSQRIEGQGQQVTFVGTAEHVRGRAAYRRVELVLPPGNADRLLDLLRREFASPRVFYWVVPALSSGRLA